MHLVRILLLVLLAVVLLLVAVPSRGVEGIGVHKNCVRLKPKCYFFPSGPGKFKKFCFTSKSTKQCSSVD